jgi:GT2 family glycosyltransferase
VIVIDDLPKNSVHLKNTVELIKSIPVKTFSVEDTWSHSEKMNRTAESTDADFLVFIDEAIQITNPNWLDQSVGTIQTDPTIGAIGSLLVSPKGKICHAGITLGVKGGVGMACRNMSCQLPGDCGRAHSIQEYSALTGEMLLVSRTAFNAVDGFDPKRYPDCYNDIDICVRMRAQGFRCVYNPMVKAVLHTGKFRSENSENKLYLIQLRRDWPELFSSDPFFNPNLSLDNEWFLGYREFPIECQSPELMEI